MISTERAPERTSLAELPSLSRAGMWAWLLQRASAALLVIFLLAHIWLLHYAFIGEKITFDRVLTRLHSPLFFYLDMALLATVIFHGLNGVRVVVMDFGIGTVVEKAFTALLVILGIILFIFGFYALLPFIR